MEGSAAADRRRELRVERKQPCLVPEVWASPNSRRLKPVLRTGNDLKSHVSSLKPDPRERATLVPPRSLPPSVCIRVHQWFRD
jgi:hypothetical protein